MASVAGEFSARSFGSEGPCSGLETGGAPTNICSVDVLSHSLLLSLWGAAGGGDCCCQISLAGRVVANDQGCCVSPQEPRQASCSACGWVDGRVSGACHGAGLQGRPRAQDPREAHGKPVGSHSASGNVQTQGNPVSEKPGSHTPRYCSLRPASGPACPAR